VGAPPLPEPVAALAAELALAVLCVALGVDPVQLR
jgi:hypothetical protein